MRDSDAMIAGRLREVVSVIRRVRGPEPHDGELVDEHVADVRCEVMTLATNESLRAAAVSAEATHLVRMRGIDSPIDETMVLDWTDRFGRTRRLEVLGIRDIEQRGRTLLVDTKELKADGA